MITAAIITAIVLISTICLGCLFLLHRAYKTYAEYTLEALAVMRSKSLTELAQFNAAQSQTKLNVEMLRDAFQKEQEQTHKTKPKVDNITQPEKKKVHDLYGQEYDLSELEIL